MKAIEAAKRSGDECASGGRSIGMMIWKEGVGILRYVQDDEKGNPLFEQVDPSWEDDLLQREGWEPFGDPPTLLTKIKRRLRGMVRKSL